MSTEELKAFIARQERELKEAIRKGAEQAREDQQAMDEILRANCVMPRRAQ